MAVPQLRSHAEIAERIIDHTVTLAPELTDFVEGSVVRSVDDSVAVVLQGVEYASFDAARQSIATGAYTSFQFSKLPAVASGGLVTLSRSSGTSAATVNAGLQVKVPGSSVRIYETTENVTFAVGVLAVTVPVRCLTAGVVGNTASGTVVNVVSGSFSGTVTNALPFLTGREEETDENRFQRFQIYVGNLAHGTVNAIENRAQSVVRYDASGNAVERVVSVRAIEPYKTGGRLGLVEVYIDNGSGTSTAALKTLVGEALEGYIDAGGKHPGRVAAGIELRVFQVAAVAIDVECQIVVIPGWDKQQTVSAVEAALISYLNGLPVFSSVILAELTTAAMNVDGVSDILFGSPTANVVITGRAVAGEMMVTA